jgi:hypothetical protein
MEKRREIPAAKPNAAPKADADRVMARIENLGLKGEDVVEAAGFGRATYFRLKKYEASVATVRALDEWLVSEERRRSKPSAPTKGDEERLLAEWMQLGEQLMGLDPQRFVQAMDGLRDMVEGVRLQQSAILKMFRANPDHRR